jgi:NIMA (never in mitosis gene a)-related kinase 1/4/5
MCALQPPFTAEDKSGLYQKVLKGQYKDIPTHYSMDMRDLIKAILVVPPAFRPTTD